jgi:hypothetical protein
VNSENIALTKAEIPTGLFVLFTLLGVGFTFVIAETILPKAPLGFFDSLIFFGSLFSGFSLYFIFKNCPISILFSFNCWFYLSKNAPALSIRPSERQFSSLSNLSIRNDRNNIITNPAYSSLSSNIYHRRR